MDRLFHIPTTFAANISTLRTIRCSSRGGETIPHKVETELQRLFFFSSSQPLTLFCLVGVVRSASQGAQRLQGDPLRGMRQGQRQPQKRPRQLLAQEQEQEQELEALATSVVRRTGARRIRALCWQR